jgi:hypothetical protein
MRVLLLAAILSGCANVAPEVTTVDAGEDTAFDPAPRETSPLEWPDEGVPDTALADAVAVEAGTCATRVDACSDGGIHPLDKLLLDCSPAVCGDYTIAVDAEGCVTAVVFDPQPYRTTSEFRACVLAELAVKRFPCLDAGTVRRYLSCTVK